MNVRKLHHSTWDSKKGMVLHVSVPIELAAELRELAAKQERSVSTLVRRALRENLRQASEQQERAA